MTAAEVARLCHAKQVRRGKWMGLCAAHGDHRPSLSIADGKRGVVMKCMSQGCSIESICAAIGIKVADLFYDTRTMSPEIKQRLKDEGRLEWLNRRYILCAMVNGRRDNLWMAIQAMEQKLFPERFNQRQEKVQNFIEKHGWDKLWDLWMTTEQGKKDAEKYGLCVKTSTRSFES